MPRIASLWSRAPVVVRAFLLGGAVATAGTVPWAVLAAWNIRHLPAVPWSVPIAALYLWLLWRWLRGDGWPASTSAARRGMLRARPVSANVWGAAILAGILGLATVVQVNRVTVGLVGLPFQDDLPYLSRLSPLTLLLMPLMGAVVAGVVEEAAFRGYMQRPIERRHGPVVAILVVGVWFGLAHATHAQWSLALMPYYLTAAAVYGGLAWITDSILPSMALHAGGDALSALTLVGEALGTPAGSGATAAPRAFPAPATHTGLWIRLAALVVLGSATVWAYAQVAAVVRQQKEAAVGASVADPGTA